MQHHRNLQRSLIREYRKHLIVDVAPRKFGVLRVEIAMPTVEAQELETDEAMADDDMMGED